MTHIDRPSRTPRPLAATTLALIGVLLTWGLAWGAAPPQVGQPAPPFAVADTAGKTWNLADLKGKKVILEWTNDGCPYVRKHSQLRPPGNGRPGGRPPPGRPGDPTLWLLG
ncbi:redoxin domain-containing protein [uncultured Thiodictyon sp.]|uniref:redoxin domain-containing protein n=1 Tax=uncultured Thiodictyon sp. TaxID=1846217 RepID=UPI0025E1F380|nr:redoxin domain-containing protein [uncultured Thiodictyon sp.]